MEIKPIQVHHLVPGGDEVLQELMLGIGAGVDLGQGAQLGIGAEDQIDAGGGPLDGAGGAIAAFEEARFAVDRLPFGGHVEQICEEIVGERLGPFGEDTVLGLAFVGVENAQAASSTVISGAVRVSN